MKKLVVAACAAALIASLVPQASAGGKQQTVEGTIALPAPFTDDSGCFAGLHRRFAIATQELVTGVIGYHFDVDPATWNKNFVLESTGGQGHIDFDITFYTEFGTVEQATDTGFAPANVPFQTRKAGGEAGKVPPDMNKVIICMYTGAQGQGAAGSFKYTAGKGVKLPK